MRVQACIRFLQVIEGETGASLICFCHVCPIVIRWLKNRQEYEHEIQ